MKIGYLFSCVAKGILKSGELNELGDYKKQYDQIAVCEFDPTETHECIVCKTVISVFQSLLFF